MIRIVNASQAGKLWSKSKHTALRWLRECEAKWCETTHQPAPWVLQSTANGGRTSRKLYNLDVLEFHCPEFGSPKRLSDRMDDVEERCGRIEENVSRVAAEIGKIRQVESRIVRHNVS